METQTTLFVQKSTLRPSRHKYKAAFSGRPPIRRQQPRTPSSESGAPCNRIARHAKSATSSPASAPTQFRQHLCRAHTITHSKYHGHRWRRNGDAVNSAVQPQHTLITPFFLSGPYFRAASSESRIVGLITGGKTKEAKGFTHKGNTQVVHVNDCYTCFIYLHAARPWIGHVK